MSTRMALVRRGLAMANNCSDKFVKEFVKQADASKDPKDAEKFLKHIARRFQSPSAIIMLAFLALAFVYTMVSIEYSIRHVATRLAIVEHTSRTGAIVLTDEPDAPLVKAPLIEDIDGEEKKLPLPDQAMALPVKPITSGLRSTMLYLQSQEGFRARFRGIKHGVFYLMCVGFLGIIFQATFAAFFGPLGIWLGTTLAALFFCNAHAAWTHAIISAPSDKTFFQRFLEPKVATQLVAPTLRLQVHIGLTHATLMCTSWAAGSRMIERQQFSWMIVLSIIIALFQGAVTVLPAYIALVRVEASLLPEDTTAIVPFDRTFGGRMTKLEEMGSKCRFAKLRKFTLRGAYMTFDRDTYKRTVKMLLKFVGVTAIFYVAFMTLFATAIYTIIGGRHNLIKLIDIARAVYRGDL